MTVFEKLQQVKEMSTQLVVCWTVYFKKYYKIIAIDSSKQKALDADPKAIQQINFTGNLDQREGATTFFIIEEAKEIVLDILQGAVSNISLKRLNITL